MQDFEEELDLATNKLEQLESSVDNFSSNLDNIDKKFEELTTLKKEDYIFILFCASLHAYRQYFITDFKPRLSASDAAREVKGDFNEKSFRNKRRYYCSLANIISNPVPFDTSEHTEKIKPCISGNNHRWKCLGHYPILGYIFGTANIMTSTVSVKNGLTGIDTYHVSTDVIHRNGLKRKYSFVGDVISSKAHTDKMFEHIYHRITTQPEEGITSLIAALAKEHEHLLSDEKTSQSLPFPILSFTPSISEELHNRGLDFINLKTVTKQSGYAFLINLITRILYLAYQAGKKITKTKSINDVSIDSTIKTRCEKILNVANVIATSSNLATVLVGALTGNLNLTCKFDIGGEIISLVQLASSAEFINQLQYEYIKQEVQLLNSNL